MDRIRNPGWKGELNEKKEERIPRKEGRLYLSLSMVHEPGHVVGGCGEPVHLLVQDVVAPEARPQARTAHQREEGEAAPDGPGLSLLETGGKVR